MRNKELAKSFKDKKCHLCERTRFTCGHHLISFKSRSDLDIKENMMCVCIHHHVEFHNKGLSFMVEKYNLQMEMIERGFFYCELTKKWRYPV